MKIREYLEKLDKAQQITFIIVRAVKDDRTPFYHPEYRDTPIWWTDDWLKPNNHELHEYIILNDHHPAISWLCGVDWNIQIRAGIIQCMLVIPQDDLDKLYPGEQQQRSMIRYINTKLDIPKPKSVK